MSTTDANHDDMILTIDEAAVYLRVPKATLYTWRTRRVGFGPPAVKFGSCLRYRRSDLDAWVAEHVESLQDDTTIPTQPDHGASLSRASGPR